MNLPVQSVEFDAKLKKMDGEMQLERIPEDLPQKAAADTVRFATPLEVQNSFAYMQPLSVIPLKRGGWGCFDSHKVKLPMLAGINLLEGERYIEEMAGIYLKKKTGELAKISNARIRLVGIQEEWVNEQECKELLLCEIRCDAWNDAVKIIEVPVGDYKQVYDCIRKKYPEVLLMANGAQALEEYLTEIYQKQSETLQHEIYTIQSGWMTLHGKTRYYLGRDAFYASYNMPQLIGGNKKSIFKEGTEFLAVGNNNMAIMLIMLVAHMAYSLFWFKKGQVDFRSVLFLKGGTNLLKTSVVREVANIFDTDRNHAVIRIASTLASVQHNICMLRDQLVCLDDFCNSEVKSKNKAVEAAEDAIRAVGDGVFTDKMVAGSRRVSSNTVRSAVILTGEEDLGLGLSSNYRTIVATITDGTFNGEVLTKFQQNPDILRRYFALYIEFLTGHGEELSHSCRTSFLQYRQEYTKVLSIPRFIDAAAGLRVQVDFLTCFAAYCGLNGREIEHMALFEERILDAMKQNQQMSVGKKPEIRFLYALMQNIGTDSKNSLAENENRYVINESQYIGFYEKENALIWILWEAAWRLVKNYYCMQGEDWIVKPNTIKMLLLKKNISDGKKMPEGQAGNECLRKARKGTRKRMLVLRQAVVDKLLESEGDA